MNTSFITSISVVGILVTGGAAFAANNTILDSYSSSEQDSKALEAAIVPGTALALEMPVLPTIPGDPTSDVEEMIVVDEPGRSEYNVEGVGLVTLEQTATGLAVVSVKPVSGWTFEVENTSATRIEVEFENGKSVEFRAELIDGRIISAVNVDDDSEEIDEVDEADETDEQDEADEDDEPDDDDSDEIDDD